MKIFMLLMYFLNMMFINFNNPLMLSIILLFQTLITILLMGKIYYSFWFSYIIFLVFIGGLFILFIYLITLTYNNKFFFTNYYKYFFMLMMFIFLLNSNKKMMFMKNDEMNMSLNFFMKENTMNCLKFTNFPNNIINIMLIIYLFMLLIIILKITNFFKGPIRNKTYY